MIPEAWQFALLALAAFRLWKLIGDDQILDGPRDRLLPWLAQRPGPDWELFIVCPWCSGAWCSLLTYLGWMATVGEWPDTVGDVFVAGGVWFALSAAVGYLGVTIDRLES